jgi:hypothetical protein
MCSAVIALLHMSKHGAATVHILAALKQGTALAEKQQKT